MFCCRGIKEDLKRRAPFYLSDWTDIFTLKIISSSLFMFFTSMSPVITFSLILMDTTDEQIGVKFVDFFSNCVHLPVFVIFLIAGAVEVLISASVCSTIFSLFAGQPMVIVGVTGPVAILTGTIYLLSKEFGHKFLPFYGWAQIWAALFHLILSACNACDLLKYMTRFSCEVFCILIAFIYIYTGVEGLVRALGDQSLSSGLLQFVITIGAASTSYYLTSAKYWKIYNNTIRTLISDYGTTLSLVLWSIVPYLARNRLSPEDEIPTLFVPLEFGTTTGRAWLVDFTDISVGGIFAAILPTIIITVLFFFDHNVSSIIAQAEEMKLKKGSSFHWDFFVVGITMVVTGALGIPPCNGLIPQVPLHVKSLTVLTRIVDPLTLEPTNEFTVSHIYEQRVTNLLQGLLCGLVTFRPFSDALREIPVAMLYGLFLYLGFAGFEDNEFIDRMQLLTVERSFRATLKSHAYYKGRNVPFRTICIFAIIQAVCIIVIFGITFTPVSVIFPVLIALLIVIRVFLLPRWFELHELHALDVAELSTTEAKHLVDCAFDHIEAGAEDANGYSCVRARHNSVSSVQEGELRGEYAAAGAAAAEAVAGGHSDRVGDEDVVIRLSNSSDLSDSDSVSENSNDNSCIGDMTNEISLNVV